MPGRIVNPRYIPATITVPAGTVATAPNLTPVNLGQVTLQEVQVTIPTGSVGLAGIAIIYAGEHILPWGGATAWIRGNGQYLIFDVDFDVSSPVTVAGFNTGRLPHSFDLRFKVADWVLPASNPTRSLVPIVAG